MGPPYGRLTGQDPDLDGVTAFRTHELRPGWVSPLPRGRRCSPGQVVSLTGACRSTAAGPSTPLRHPIGGALPYEASTELHAIHPSGLPLACGRPDGTGRPWAFPRASHPADREPTTHAEAGTGHRARTWNYTLNVTSVDPPIGSSLTACDLASHDDQQECRSAALLLDEPGADGRALLLHKSSSPRDRIADPRDGRNRPQQASRTLDWRRSLARKSGRAAWPLVRVLHTRTRPSRRSREGQTARSGSC
jgi:hypothetical protein